MEARLKRTHVSQFSSRFEELEEEVVLLLLLHKTLKKKGTHKFWIIPLLNSRQERGVIYTTVNDLRNNESQFFIYFRMSVGSVDARLRLIYNDISRTDTNVFLSEEWLAVTWR